MFRISPKAACWLSICAFSLTACSDGDLAPEPQPHEADREFSEAEKRAARALSISNTEIMAKAEGPYEQTLLCRHGLAEVASLLGETASLSSEQEQGLRQAEALFDRRLRDLASANGKSAEDVENDLAQTAEDNPDRATNMRIAIGCLERLRPS